MARLNIQLDSDDELPELSSILGFRIEGAVTNIPKSPTQEPSEISVDKEETQSLVKNDRLTKTHAVAPRTLTDVSSNKPLSRKQQPPRYLKRAYVDSFFLPTSQLSTGDPEGEDDHSEEAFNHLSIGVNSGILSKGIADYSRQAQVSANIHEAVHHDDCSYANLSDFVVPDSASDAEVLASRSPKKKKSRSPKKIPTTRLQEPGLPLSRQPLTNIRQPFKTSVFILPGKNYRNKICQESPPSDKSFRSELVESHSKLNDHLTL